MRAAQKIVHTYANPVVSGFHPDPSICRAGDDYFLVHSTFELFPGVPVYHSRDLVHWRLIGHCLTRENQLDLTGIKTSAGIFAPTIRYHDGVFYMITTVMGGRGNFYVTARDPAGPWSDPVWLDEEGFDPSLFFDDDGTVYYTRHAGDQRGAIAQTTLDLQKGTLQGEVREIWKGTGGIWPEGPHLYKLNGKYYLLISEGGTSYGHMLTIARSDSPRGPFEACPRNPILSHRGRPRHLFQALGHADMVQTPDGWWMVCLGIRPWRGKYHHLGRETFLTSLSWSEDGWPVVRDVESSMPAPRLPEHPFPAPPERDDFNATALGLQWNYLRNPKPAGYSLTERPGFLRLKGGETSLGSIDSPVFVGRRQEHMTCRAAAVLDFIPREENEEAGLALRGNERNYFALGLLLRHGKRRLMYRRVLAGRMKTRLLAELPDRGSVILTVKATPSRYEICYCSEGGKETRAAVEKPSALATEKIGGFTGVYFGMYATGNGKTCTTPADFDWFEYHGSIV